MCQLVRCASFLLHQTSLQGLREVLREVTVLGSYRHPQLVPLVCFSLSRQGGQQEACLVYPLMPGGSLDCAIANRAARPLGAAARLRIAADTAAGLAYLHRPGGGLAALLHRDVKSSNVLLDEGMRARVADVGLARPQRGATMTAGVGTFGYMDPEYFETGERQL
jgi:serine/threonine protein kinase